MTTTWTDENLGNRTYADVNGLRTSAGGLRSLARQDRRVHGEANRLQRRRPRPPGPDPPRVRRRRHGPPSYYAGEMFALLDGGLRDGGWMGENRPMGGHALAVIPNATHYNVFASPVLAAAALDFLDAPPA